MIESVDREEHPLFYNKAKGRRSNLSEERLAEIHNENMAEIDRKLQLEKYIKFDLYNLDRFVKLVPNQFINGNNNLNRSSLTVKNIEEVLTFLYKLNNNFLCNG